MSIIRPSKSLQKIKLHDCKIFIVVEHGLITCLTVTSYRYFLGRGGGVEWTEGHLLLNTQLYV